MPAGRPQIDWDGLRERMLRTQLALEKSAADDPDYVEAVFRRRAARLSQPAVQYSARSTGTEYLVFSLRSERYALPLRSVAEVVARPSITPVPGSPPELQGVMNLRGEIRPVWDLARRLGLPEQGKPAPGCVLVLRGRRQPTGWQVDHVEQVRAMPAQEWRKSGAQSDRVKGTTPDMITLLAVEALLTEEGSR